MHAPAVATACSSPLPLTDCGRMNSELTLRLCYTSKVTRVARAGCTLGSLLHETVVDHVQSKLNWSGGATSSPLLRAYDLCKVAVQQTRCVAWRSCRLPIRALFLECL